MFTEDVGTYINYINAHIDINLRIVLKKQEVIQFKEIKKLLEFETLKSVVKKISNETDYPKNTIYNEALKIKGENINEIYGAIVSLKKTFQRTEQRTLFRASILDICIRDGRS